jgi:hypothetical protein
MRHPRRVPDGTPHSPNPLLGVAVVHLIVTYTSTVITVPGPAEPPPDLRDVSKPNAPQFAKLALDPRSVGTHFTQAKLEWASATSTEPSSTASLLALPLVPPQWLCKPLSSLVSANKRDS